MSQNEAFDFFELTDIGCNRTNNEDNLYHMTNENKDHIMLVADGMGGHKSGEVASALVVEAFRGFLGRFENIVNEYINDLDPDNKNSDHKDNSYVPENFHKKIVFLLEDTIQEANDKILDQAASNEDCSNMGTTVTAAFMHNGYMYFGHVGDSRGYLLRKGELRQLTRDHSFVAEQVRLGILTPDEAENHPQKNLLTRALGVSDIVKVDIFHETMLSGDIVLLCSDGLNGPVSDSEIKDIILLASDAEDACKKLIERARLNGGPDNITASIYHLKDLTILQKFCRWVKNKFLA
jgi:protein phosphatase